MHQVKRRCVVTAGSERNADAGSSQALTRCRSLITVMDSITHPADRGRLPPNRERPMVTPWNTKASIPSRQSARESSPNNRNSNAAETRHAVVTEADSAISVPNADGCMDSGREGCCAITDRQPAPIDGLLRRAGPILGGAGHLPTARYRPLIATTRLIPRPTGGGHPHAAAQRWSLVRDEQRRPF